ncbi:MAG: LytR C-terminal domain-containing protein [Deltaproteobacteria bacterium]|jgi:hypothetical protein|nr:LytR C-terminal domain-containing protein [Deltaproteobacteria bacterium]
MKFSIPAPNHDLRLPAAAVKLTKKLLSRLLTIIGVLGLTLTQSAWAQNEPYDDDLSSLFGDSESDTAAPLTGLANQPLSPSPSVLSYPPPPSASPYELTPPPRAASVGDNSVSSDLVPETDEGVDEPSFSPPEGAGEPPNFDPFGTADNTQDLPEPIVSQDASPQSNQADGVENRPVSPAPSAAASPPISRAGELSLTESALPPEDSDQALNDSGTQIDAEPASSTLEPGQPLSGQLRTPPPPSWQRESRETAGVPAAGGPLPDFDSSQGRWQQMEVGQFDRPLNSVATQRGSTSGAINPAPSARTTAETLAAGQDGLQNMGQTAQAAPAASNQNSGRNPAGSETDRQRAELTQLFQDLIPEPPATNSSPNNAAAGALGTNNAAPLGTANQNSLTVPLLPPPPPTQPVAVVSSPSPPVALPPPPPAAAAMPSPATQTPTAAKAEPQPAAAPAQEDFAISRAGSVMAEFGMTPKTGSAAVISPADLSPAASVSTPATSQAAATAASTRPVAASQASAQTKPKSPAPIRPNLSVMLINETGRSQVGEDYRSVLSQMGYTVVAVSSRNPSGGAGQTEIAYRPDQRGQVQLLSRHLPGHKILNPTDQNLPAGALVIIR